MNLGTQDIGRSISAAGTTQATATLLINGICLLTTVAASSGVLLNANAGTGSSQVVYNGGANPVKVYPPVGYAINGLTTNGAHVLATNTTCIYFVVSDTQIIGNLSA